MATNRQGFQPAPVQARNIDRLFEEDEEEIAYENDLEEDDAQDEEEEEG